MPGKKGTSAPPGENCMHVGQRAGRHAGPLDKAAEGGVGTPRIGDPVEGIGSRAGARFAIRGLKDRRAIGAGRLVDRIAMAPFHRRLEMAAAAEQVGAGRRAEIVAHGVGIGGNAGVDVGLEAGEFLVEDEVDHAGHRVGAIDGGSAAGDHIHPRNQHLRNGVDVHRAVVVRRREAVAVHQHQGALGAEIAQVQGAAGIVVAAVAGAADDPRTLEDRQLVQAVGNAGGGVALRSSVETTVSGVGELAASEMTRLPVTVTDSTLSWPGQRPRSEGPPRQRRRQASV